MEMDKEWDIPDDYLAEIGRITVRWSKLQTHMNFSLIQLSGGSLFERRQQAIFLHMSFPQKMDILGVLVLECLTNPKYHFLSVYKAQVEPLLAEASARRNRIIHCSWGMENDAVAQSNITARRRIKVDKSTVSLSEIESTSRKIVEAADALFSMVTAGNPPSDTPQSGQ
jgi:hypothetical protein